MDPFDEEIEIVPMRSLDGRTVDLRMKKKSGAPITMNEFICELENYLYLITKASRERTALGAEQA